MNKWAALLVRGALAGLAASTVQVIVGKAEEILLPLRRDEDADIAPRLVGTSCRKCGLETTNASRWTLGTLFHFGYGAMVWGMGYAASGRKTCGEEAAGTPAGGRNPARF